MWGWARTADIGLALTRQTRSPPQSLPVTDASKSPRWPSTLSGVMASGGNTRTPLPSDEARIGTSGPLDTRQPEVTKAPEPLGYGPVDRATVTEWPRMTTLRRFTHRIGLIGCTPPNVSN